MSFGINYKYNGLLHHNSDRVWIITKVALPKLKDISFPDITFDPNCPFVRNLMHSRTAAQQVEKIRSICRSMKPLVSLMPDATPICPSQLYSKTQQGCQDENWPH